MNKYPSNLITLSVSCALILTTTVVTVVTLSAQSAKELHQLDSTSKQLSSFRYDVDKSGEDWIVTFKQRSHIRHHTSPSHAPYVDMWINPNNENLKVAPGQWLEAFIDGKISLLSDADHR